MKSLTLLITLLTSVTTHASLKELVCSSGRRGQVFSATLDPGTNDPNRGYFRLKNATVSDYYLLTVLHCVDSTLENIQCIGFPYNTGDFVIKLSVKKMGNQYYSSYRALEGDVEQHSAPWPCSVRPLSHTRRGPYEAE